MIERSGFVALFGRPNVGKSTLINRLVGQKVAIVSPKPQTTRNRILGVLTEGDTQVVFMDTPGLHKPHNRLGEYMMKAANDTVSDVDLALLVVEPTSRISDIEREIAEKLQAFGVPTILVINKIDVNSAEKVAPAIAMYAELMEFEAVVPVSALTGNGTDIVRKEILSRMQEGPGFFDEDVYTDQPERVMVGEILREKALYLLDKEVPHGLAVDIEAFEEGEDLITIKAAIVCEKESHKGIIIGKGGKTLKTMATRARIDMEKLLDCKVFLSVFVKVRERWRDKPSELKNFGFRDEQ